VERALLEVAVEVVEDQEEDRKEEQVVEVRGDGED